MIRDACPSLSLFDHATMQAALERGSEPAPVGPARRPPWPPRSSAPLGWLIAGYLFQVAPFDSRRDPVPRLEWVIAGARWRQARTIGAQRVWIHAPYRQALWHLPAGR